MEICLPHGGENCSGLSETDFDTFKIPAPPHGVETGENTTLLLFKTPEEALKYAIHLNDVYLRMEASSEYDCSREKIKLIIEAVNQQVDFKSIDFD